MHPGRDEKKAAGEQQKKPVAGHPDPVPAKKEPPGSPDAAGYLVQPIGQVSHAAQPPLSDVIEATDLNWEKTVEKGTAPIAVMFYSPACVFCRQMEPHFRNYAAEYHGRVTFARLNVMTNSWTAERYGVRSTPTFKFFCNGKPVQEMVGAVYPTLLRKIVDDVLLHGKECAKNSTVIDYEITGYG